MTLAHFAPSHLPPILLHSAGLARVEYWPKIAHVGSAPGKKIGPSGIYFVSRWGQEIPIKKAFVIGLLHL